MIEEKDRCKERVYRGSWPRPERCARRNGHGPDGGYCKQHNPAAEAARKAESSRRYKEKRISDRKMNFVWAGGNILKDALEKYANGDCSCELHGETARKALEEWRKHIES